MIQRLISKNWLKLSLIFVVAFGLSFGTASLIRILVFSRPSTDAESAPATADIAEETIIDTTPDFIDLQNCLNAWVADLTAASSVSVSVYDLDYAQVAAAYNSNLTLSSVALSEFMTTYLENLDDSTLQVSHLIEELGLTETSADGAYSNAHDASLFLQFLWQHDDLTTSSWAELLNNLLQPTSSVGLASGLKTAIVYAQNSLETLSDMSPIYSSLGFFETISENRHYAFVLLGNLTAEDAEKLGEAIEMALAEASAASEVTPGETSNISEATE